MSAIRERLSNWGPCGDCAQRTRSRPPPCGTPPFRCARTRDLLGHRVDDVRLRLPRTARPIVARNRTACIWWWRDDLRADCATRAGDAVGSKHPLHVCGDDDDAEWSMKTNYAAMEQQQQQQGRQCRKFGATVCAHLSRNNKLHRKGD